MILSRQAYNLGMKEDFLLRFGERIKALRLAKGLSQEALGEKAHLHRTYIGMIERGEKNITLKNIYRLSVALEISTKELFKF